MKNINVWKKVLPVLLLVLLFHAAPSFAWGGSRHHDQNYRHHRRHHHHPRHYVHQHYPKYGKVVFELPRTSVTIVFGKQRYHYCDGVYYSRRNVREYVVVPPPDEID